MQKAFSPQSARYQAMIMLVLMTFVFRAMIPVGFMPDFSRDGGTPFVICAGLGEKTVLLDADGQPTGHAQQAGVEMPCGFAMGGMALADAPPALILPALAALQAAAPHDDAVFARLPHAYPARAPPDA